LVPREQVSREIRGEDDQQEQRSDHPVELPRPVKRPREESPEQVQERDDDEEVRAPVVHVPDEPAEAHVATQRLDRAVRPLGSRLVYEHEQHAGQDEQEHEGSGHSAEAERVPERDRALRQTHRPHVQNEVVEDDALPFPLRPGSQRGSKDRAPDAGSEAGFTNHEPSDLETPADDELPGPVLQIEVIHRSGQTVGVAEIGRQGGTRKLVRKAGAEGNARWP
jgi:hypothetical protein